MTLATKLQSVHVKVNTKLGYQDGPIQLVKRAVASGGIGEVQTGTATTVTIEEGCRVQQVSDRKIQPNGPYKLDDLEMFIPKSLATRTQIEGAHIVYNSGEYDIFTFGSARLAGTPPVMGGDVINWRIVARKRGG